MPKTYKRIEVKMNINQIYYKGNDWIENQKNQQT